MLQKRQRTRQRKPEKKQDEEVKQLKKDILETGKAKVSLQVQVDKATGELKKLKTRLDEEESAKKDLEDARAKIEKSSREVIEKVSNLESELKKHSDALVEEKAAHASLKKKVQVLMS